MSRGRPVSLFARRLRGDLRGRPIRRDSRCDFVRRHRAHRCCRHLHAASGTSERYGAAAEPRCRGGTAALEQQLSQPPMPPKPPSLAVLVAITAINPLAINILQPALPEIARTLATDYGTVQLTLALYLVASAVSQIALGPISDNSDAGRWRSPASSISSQAPRMLRRNLGPDTRGRPYRAGRRRRHGLRHFARSGPRYARARCIREQARRHQDGDGDRSDDRAAHRRMASQTSVTKHLRFHGAVRLAALVFAS